MDWWLWIVLGLMLAGLELLVAGTFFVMFFGAGAIFTGLLTAFGLSGPAWVQWLVFTGSSVLALLLLRDPIQARLRRGPRRPEVDAIAGQVAIALDDIEPRRMGRAELRGSTWTARNVGEALIRRGARCRVDRVDGLQLFVRAEGGD